MAWYLNEVLTDLSVLPGALSILSGQPKDTLRPGVPDPDNVYEYLRDSGVNLGLLDETIGPEEHGGDVYRWLASDLLVLCRNLSLIDPQAPTSPPVDLTDLGRALADESVSLGSALAGGLFHWKFGESKPITPMISILEVLRQLRDKKPCKGLLLPEFILAMRKLEQGKTADDCVKDILSRRKETAGNAGESEIEVRKHICEQYLSQDELSVRDVTCGRSTQVNILSSGLAQYGGLLDEVQFMEIGWGFFQSLEMKEELAGRLAGMEPREIALIMDKLPGI